MVVEPVSASISEVSLWEPQPTRTRAHSRTVNMRIAGSSSFLFGAVNHRALCAAPIPDDGMAGLILGRLVRCNVAQMVAASPPSAFVVMVYPEQSGVRGESFFPRDGGLRRLWRPRGRDGFQRLDRLAL